MEIVHRSSLVTGSFLLRLLVSMTMQSEYMHVKAIVVDFQNSILLFNRGTRRAVTIRVGTPHQEVLEVRRHFKHPGYEHPKFYDDIAILELGKLYILDLFSYAIASCCTDEPCDNPLLCFD